MHYILILPLKRYVLIRYALQVTFTFIKRYLLSVTLHAIKEKSIVAFWVVT